MISFVKKAQDLAPTKSPKYLLHNHLHGPEKARSLLRVHASELTKERGFCPRYYALHDVTKKRPKDEWLSTSEVVTYRMGHDQQDAIAHWFADMGKAIGHWTCVACGCVHEFTARPAKCQNCGVRVFKPTEVRFESAATGASCGVDLLLNLGEPKLRPIELKTMEKEEFKNLKAPLAEHRQRTALYLRIIAESEQPWASMVGAEVATILYVSKSGYGCLDDGLAKWGLKEKFSPFKEWEIKRDDKLTDEACKRAKVVKDFRDGLVGMPCGVCLSSLSERAKWCAYKAQCWSGDYPVEHDWKGE